MAPSRPGDGTALPEPFSPTLALSNPDWVLPGTEGWAWIKGSGPSALEASRSWMWAEKASLGPGSLRAQVGDGPWGSRAHLSFQAWRRPRRSQWAPRLAWRRARKS